MILLKCKGSEILIKDSLESILYVLKGNVVLGEAAVTSRSSNQNQLWHLRLSHMSDKSVICFEPTKLVEWV